MHISSNLNICAYLIHRDPTAICQCHAVNHSFKWQHWQMTSFCLKGCRSALTDFKFMFNLEKKMILKYAGPQMHFDLGPIIACKGFSHSIGNCWNAQKDMIPVLKMDMRLNHPQILF